MAKLTLNDYGTLVGLAAAVNANNALVETAMENTLSRDGTTPNTMTASLDMNANRIINLPAAVSSGDAVRKADLDAKVLDSDSVSYATQGEAEAGTSEVKVMNPLRTKQAFDTFIDATSFVTPYDTRAEAAADSIPASFDHVVIAGYAAAGDGGSALYKRVVSEPSHVGKFTSADGAFWELANTVVLPEMFGTIGTNAAGDTAAVQAAAAVSFAISRPLHFLPRTYNLNAAISLESGQTVVLASNTRINQTTADTRIFSAVSKDRVWIHCNGALLYGEGTWSALWTGNTSHYDRAIDFAGCTRSGVTFPTIRDCGHSGIAIRGGNDITILGARIEGTHAYSTVLPSEANFQNGIYILDETTYGVSTNVKIIAPQISGVAQGVLVESYPLLDYSDRTITITDPVVHDIPGQHAFYIQGGGITITNPMMRNLELAGVKVQTTAGSNLAIRNVVVTGANGKDITSNLFEIAHIGGTGSISNVFLEGIGDAIGTGLAVVGNVNDLKARLILATATGHAVLIQGDGPDDLDIDVFARSVAQHGIVVSATTANNIRIRPVIRNANSGNTASQYGIVVASASANVALFNPEFTDSASQMAYGIAATASGSVVTIYGEPVITGFATGDVLTSSGGIVRGDYWQDYTATVTTTTGTPTVTTNAAHYRRSGKIVFLVLDFSLAGACTGNVNITLPVDASVAANLSAMENSVTGATVRATIRPGTLTSIQLATYDGNAVAGDGRRFVVTGSYEIA